jgi:hypothetical protein
LWLIDHGACLYFHHSWDNRDEYTKKPFVQVKDHVLLPAAAHIAAAGKKYRDVLTEEKVRSIVDLLPDEWLAGGSFTESPGEVREIYSRFILERLANADIFEKEAEHARHALV